MCVFVCVHMGISLGGESGSARVPRSSEGNFVEWFSPSTFYMSLLAGLPIPLPTEPLPRAKIIF